MLQVMTSGISAHLFGTGMSPRWAVPLAVGLLVTGLAPALAASGPAQAGAQAPRFMVTHDCEEEQAFVDGDATEVARALPAGYTPVADSAFGTRVGFLRALDCAAVLVDCQSGRARFASYGVTVNSPDGTGCSSA